jgi:hypothetical protein
MLLLAISRSQAFGEYSPFGAFLLMPALFFCAAGIFTSSAQKLTSSNEGRLLLLRLLVCAALLHHCIAGISMIRNIPGGIIDVYLFQHHSAAALLHGIDPYTLTTENIYGAHSHLYGPGIVMNRQVQIGYPYPPASLLFVIPFHVLGDIRYAYLTAVVLSASIIVALRTNFLTAVIACLLLLSPVTAYVERQSWTEPFVLLALTCTTYAAVKRRWWLPLALGIFIASKQYCVLALPFVPLLLGESRWKLPAWKLLAKAVGIAAVFTLPMALWDLRGFFRDVVLFQIRQPFRDDALTLGNLLFPFPLSLILVLVTIGTAFALRKAQPHPSMFAGCYAFTLLIFVCTNKQAFCNYYFLIVQALLLAIATLEIPTTPELDSVQMRKVDRRELQPVC